MALWSFLATLSEWRRILFTRSPSYDKGGDDDRTGWIILLFTQFLMWLSRSINPPTESVSLKGLYNAALSIIFLHLVLQSSRCAVLMSSVLRLTVRRRLFNKDL
uniref:ORF20 n=1 Tax=Malaco herpesvirus 4 TaxID=3031800 RepID=A0AA48P8Y1_9VIRU|nr:TPA_asm: ORF20 [Malaco herpesvirus 4]